MTKKKCHRESAGMTPGGTDVVIVTHHPVELMELTVRWLFTHWKHGVACDAAGARLWFPQSYYRIPFGESTELFVYPTEKAFVASREEPNSVEQMHLLRRDNELTVVMDAGSQIGEALVEVLKNTKFPGDV